MIDKLLSKGETLPLKQVSINDEFWNRYTNLVENVLIPYQWEILNDRIEGIEPSHCIQNLKIAAGEENGNFSGAVFQDTDIAKWLEAAAQLLAVKKNDELEKQADYVIDLLEKAQMPDGYINTYFSIEAPNKRWTNLQEGHELYTAGHLIEAAVAYYKGTGKRKFLDLVIRFADLICDVFSDEKNKLGYPGHQEIELALIKLYEVTGNENYLNQAKRFIDRRGIGENYFLNEEKKPEFKRFFPEFENYLPLYSQSHLPVREQETAEGHAVRAVYMYCAMADLAYYYDDKKLLDVCNVLWNNMVNKRMYITGAIGSSGLLERFTTDYDLPNERAYSETCASIGLALFGRRMSQITKDASYYDGVERALYNTLLSGVAQDGQSFFYVNPLEVWPESCLPRTSMEHVKPIRQKWYGVACCPPNINRTLASLGEYIYFIDNNKLFINLFVSNSTTYYVDNEEIMVQINTKFPFEGKVEISIKTKNNIKKEIAIRIPSYSQNYKFECDGDCSDKSLNNGYLNFTISDDEVNINLELDVSPKFIYSNTKVRSNTQKTAILKGPLVYCLEEVDNGRELQDIFVDTTKDLVESYDANLLGGTVVIEGCGVRLENINDKLYSFEKPKQNPVSFKAVPYAYWGNREKGEMKVWMSFID